MAAQETKFIDVTRTYIPVNPNAFPDSLHVKETPEERVPVMAYKGYNFLPTAYGYRSFFGIGQDLGISAIAERVDHVFVYQNNSFENILIALCDSGIWYKAGDVSGAWTQVLALPDYREDLRHFTWTFCIINDALYCYRQNGPSYQKFVSNASAPGFTMTSVVPNFLNMSAQQGIFRAGARLGFWDSSDSTAWSNLDDFADFTPSIETLANATTFSSVVGRIVTIKSHGDGFMIYGTKSAVYIAENSESLFQWDPSRTLDVAGIAYPHEVVAGVPDNTHYMYSSVGLYQIKNAIAEIIIPEVTDYFKESTGPKYVRFLEGRYLCFQSLDAEYINGVPQFSDELIPATIITFPGANLDLADAVADAETEGGQSYCPIFNGLSNGAYNQPGPPNDDPSVVWRPQYTAYLSSAGEINPDVEWTTNPCSVTNVATGIPYAMTPVGTPTLENATTGTGDKREVTGAEAYVDGVWTIERFTQAQLAIWSTQQAQLAAKLGNILERSHFSTRTYENPTEINSVVETVCDIGDYVTAYSGARFGFSKCEFWLTRFAIAAAKLRVRKTIRVTSVFVPEERLPQPVLGYKMGTSFHGPCTGLPYSATAREAYDACCVLANGGACAVGATLVPNATDGYGRITGYDAPLGYTVVLHYDPVPPAGYTISETAPGPSIVKAAYWQVTETATAYIEAQAIPIAPTPETGTCKLTSWKDIVSGTVIPADTCVAPAEVGDNQGSGPPVKGVNQQNGGLCSEPFEPFIIPGTPDVTVFWPDQTVTIPSGSFFLQDGSAEPLYPTFEGAWIYDTHLKKWGVYKGRHKQLLDYSPINSYGPSSQSYARFGIMGGILAEGGKLNLFDSFPTDSYITYGKVGYYRQGVTSVEEVHITMKQPVDCTVTVDTSLEGSNLTTGLTKSESYVAATKVSFYGGYPGRWHNITIEGRFDISYMEFRGIKSGMR